MLEAGGQTFRSKVDTWLALVVAAAIGSTWFPVVGRIWARSGIDLGAIIIPLAATAFVGWIFTTTYYVITADALIVRAGPIRRTIRLQSIQRMRATHNPLSSPALSLDRIEVMYDSRRILVSPRDKRGFVGAVVARVPTVVLEGLSVT